MAAGSIERRRRTRVMQIGLIFDRRHFAFQSVACHFEHPSEEALARQAPRDKVSVAIELGDLLRREFVARRSGRFFAIEVGGCHWNPSKNAASARELPPRLSYRR